MMWSYRFSTWRELITARDIARFVFRGRRANYIVRVAKGDGCYLLQIETA